MSDEEKPPREYVESLMVKGAYKTSNQSTLEAYVEAQALGKGSYYFEANKALLKIYQFLPNTADTNKFALVLLLSMLEFPSASVDWLAISYLIPERIQKSEPCSTVLQCTNLLDGCEFVEFWKTFDTLSSVCGEDKYTKALLDSGRAKKTLQNGILQAMSLTYRSARLDTVLANLNMDSSSASSLTEISSCVESVSADTVTFVATTDNIKRGRVFQEGVSYGAIANMMSNVVTTE
jgi:translation initiation factor 3 subunit K